MRTVHDAATREKSVPCPPSLAMRRQTSSHPHRFHLAHPPAANIPATQPERRSVHAIAILQHRRRKVLLGTETSPLPSRRYRQSDRRTEHKTHEAELACTPHPAANCASPPPRRLRDTDRHPHWRKGSALPTPRKCPAVPRCYHDGARRGRSILASLQTAFLIFFPAATRTGVVSANFSMPS